MYNISIIIPTYNSKKTFESTFNSILKQSIGFENIELIYVDDCSTDGTCEIIQSYSKKYNNVKFFSTKFNSGFPSKPRNIGIKNATSDYIMFLDQDDLFFETSCEFLYELITKNNVDLVSGNYILREHDEDKIVKWDLLNLEENERIYLKSIHENEKLLLLNPSIWTKIYKKDFLKKNKIFFEEVLCEDVIFVTECLFKAKGIIYINKPIVHYLIRLTKNERSLSVTKNYVVLNSFIKGLNLFREKLIKKDEKYKWLASRHLTYWSSQFIQSNISNKNKLNLLIQAKTLFEEYYNANLYNNEYKEFVYNVSHENYFDAIKISKYMDTAINKKSNFENVILNSKIYILLSKNYLEYENIIKMFLIYKIKVTLVFVDFDEDSTKIQDSFKNYDTINIIDITSFFGNKIKYLNDEIVLHLNLEKKLTLNFSSKESFLKYFLNQIFINENNYFLINTITALLNDAHNLKGYKIHILDNTNYKLFNLKETDMILLNDKNLDSTTPNETNLNNVFYTPKNFIITLDNDDEFIKHRLKTIFKEWMILLEISYSKNKLYEYNLEYNMKLYKNNFKLIEENKTKEITNINKTLNKLSKDNIELNNKLKLIENSNSWKITKPLRLFKRIFK